MQGSPDPDWWGQSAKKLHLKANTFEGEFPGKPTMPPPDGYLAGGGLRTSFRPTLNLLCLLLCAYV